MKKVSFVLFMIATFAGYANAQSCDSSDPNCPTSADCAMTIDQVTARMTADLKQCTKYQSSAQNCCGSGSNCSSGGTSMDGDVSSMMKSVMMLGAAVALSQASNDPTQMSQYASMCQMMTASGGLNNNVASSCSSSKDECDNNCGGSLTYYKNLGLCLTQSDAKQYVTDYKGDFATAQRTCDRLTASVIKAQGTNQTNGGMGNFCNQLQQQQQQMTAIAAPASLDCSNPALASTTACAVCNASPGSAACAAAIKDTAGAQPASFQSPSASTMGGIPNVGSPGVLAQGPQFPSANNPNSGNANGPMPFGQNGSSPMAQMQPQANAGGANNAGGRGYGAGYDPARTLQGERGGGGGVASANGTPDTSFQGYANGTDRSVAGLDLRNYLPGRQLYAGRKVAGVGSANPDINARTTDIFKRISDRFQVICSLNRLVDCAPATVPNKTGM